MGAVSRPPGTATYGILLGLAATSAGITGCATQPRSEAAAPPVVVIPADPARDQLNAPDPDAAPPVDPASRKPTIDDPGLQLLH